METIRPGPRGHETITSDDGKEVLYADDKQLVFDEFGLATKRPCIRCNQMPTEEGYDACLGHLEGVSAACCGHGVEEPYIAYTGKDGEHAPYVTLWANQGNLTLKELAKILPNEKVYFSDGEWKTISNTTAVYGTKEYNVRYLLPYSIAFCAEKDKELWIEKEKKEKTEELDKWNKRRSMEARGADLDIENKYMLNKVRIVPISHEGDAKNTCRQVHYQFLLSSEDGEELELFIDASCFTHFEMTGIKKGKVMKYGDWYFWPAENKIKD